MDHGTIKVKPLRDLQSWQDCGSHNACNGPVSPSNQFLNEKPNFPDSHGLSKHLSLDELQDLLVVQCPCTGFIQVPSSQCSLIIYTVI